VAINDIEILRPSSLGVKATNEVKESGYKKED